MTSLRSPAPRGRSVALREPYHGQRARVDERAGLAARWILAEFDAYYVESRSIPTLAKSAFERRDPATSLD